MSGDQTPKLKPSFCSTRVKRLSSGNSNAYKNPLLEDASPNISGIVSPSPTMQVKRPCHRNRLSSANNSFKSPLIHSSLPACISQNVGSHTPLTKQGTNKSCESPVNNSLTSPSDSTSTVAKDACQTPKKLNSLHEVVTSPDSSSLKETANKLQLEVQRLDEEINSLKDQGYKVEELKWYIDKLHEYNEIKDAAQMIMGRIAERKGTTVKMIHDEYGLDEND